MKYFRGLPGGNPLLLFIIPIKAKYAGLYVPLHIPLLLHLLLSQRYF